MSQEQTNTFMIKALTDMVAKSEIEDNWKNEYAIGFITKMHPKILRGESLTPKQQQFLEDCFHKDRWYEED